jgi:hypothetical protein
MNSIESWRALSDFYKARWSVHREGVEEVGGRAVVVVSHSAESDASDRVAGSVSGTVLKFC